MKIQTIFRMPSPYRDDFRIQAYTFGAGRHALCVVGSMRGDEMQQQYVASQLVACLKRAEEAGLIAPDISLTVIPSANPSSINIEKRFWALDGTDINRMFPGYDQGETTQRIAAGLFEYIKDFDHGIQLASYYLPGHFLPHVRIIHTGFEDIEEARLFGFPYIDVHNPRPFDTVLLNYNWQIWETKAYSLYAGTTDVIDHATAEASLDAICRFIYQKGWSAQLLRPHAEATQQSSEVIDESTLLNIQAPHAGLFLLSVEAGQTVTRGQRLALILHPYEGHVIAEITAPEAGTVFFARNKSITFQNTLLFRLIRKSEPSEQQ